MRVDYKKIETEEQFLNWANEANLCYNDLEYKIKLQDVLGHSEVQVLKDLFLSLTHKNSSNTRLLLFSIWKTNGDDYWWTFSRYLHIKVVNDQIEADYQGVVDEANKLVADKNRFNECKKGYHKRMRELKDEIVKLQRKITYLKQDLDISEKSRYEAKMERAQYQREAENFRKIKILLGGKL